MPSPDFTPARNQPLQTRSLKLVVVALILSNVIMGVVSVMLLRSLDQRYTDLINRTVPALNDLRALSADTLQVFRTIGPTALTNLPESKRGEAMQQARTAAITERKSLATTLANPSLSGPSKYGAELPTTGAIFGQQIEEFIRLFEEGKITEATRYRDSTLRPTFDAYLTLIATTADAIETDGLKASDSASVTMEGFSKIMIALASWPLFVIGGLLLVTALFVLFLMVAFRGRDLSEAP